MAFQNKKAMTSLWSDPSGVRQWLRKDSPINQPAAVLIATVCLQLFGWIGQQYYLASQEAASSQRVVTEKMVTAVSHALFAFGSVVRAHDARVEQTGWLVVDATFREHKAQWDIAKDLVQADIATKFGEDPAIVKGWTDLRSAVNELDKRIFQLASIEPANESPEHLDLTAQCSKAIEGIRQQQEGLVTRIGGQSGAAADFRLSVIDFVLVGVVLLEAAVIFTLLRRRAQA